MPDSEDLALVAGIDDEFEVALPERTVSIELKSEEQSSGIKLPSLQKKIHQPKIEVVGEKKKEEKKFKAFVDYKNLPRSESLPANGKRSGCAKDGKVDIFLQLSVNKDICRMSLNPEMRLGPEITPRQNAYTEMWGWDAENQGCFAGKGDPIDVWRADRDEKEKKRPKSLKGKVAKLMGLPIEELQLSIGNLQMTNNMSTLTNYGITHGTVVSISVDQRARRKRIQAERLDAETAQREALEKKNLKLDLIKMHPFKSHSKDSTSSKLGHSQSAPSLNSDMSVSDSKKVKIDHKAAQTEALKERINQAKFLPQLSSTLKKQTKTINPFSMRESPYIRHQKSVGSYWIMPTWKSQEVPNLFGNRGGELGRADSRNDFISMKEDGYWGRSQAVHIIRKKFEQNRGEYEKATDMSSPAFLKKAIRIMLQKEVRLKDVFAQWKACSVSSKIEAAKNAHRHRHLASAK